jgi:CO dehydrogenase/acetyl-CoA synthase gamma subunit (corrinoid Fe-S protein)
MNFLKMLLLAFVLVSCGTKTDKRFAMFAKLHKGRDIIFVSCVRCDCMIDMLNMVNAQKPALLASYDIYIDSTCKSTLSKSIPTVHIGQATVDSLSVDVYNALIIKKRGTDYVTRLIETKEAEQLPKYLAQ